MTLEVLHCGVSLFLFLVDGNTCPVLSTIQCVTAVSTYDNL